MRLHRSLLALLGVTAACAIDPYRLGGGEDAGPPDAAIDAVVADSGPDAPPADATPTDACVPVPETCNHEDDDCDGVADNGFNFNANPSHCGDCNQPCNRPNMSGTCDTGTCAFTCLPGFHDLNMDIDTDGCEYPCVVTNMGVEDCDDVDNDCNGVVDDGFDLANDPDNCGDCGRVCIAVHATPTCSGGVCGFMDCEPGFVDLIPGVVGCEYQCPVNPPVAEACNNADDDCDGTIDDGNPGGGASCGGGPGICTPGTTTCQFGSLACVGAGTPAAETCNDLDDDCDGTADEDFDKQNDPRWCGSCATPCNLPFAIEGCSMGACTIAACESGHVNLDGDPANGCEYACTPLGPEVCDGDDNDCDGLVDTDDPTLLVPSNFCATGGACGGTAPTCGVAPCDTDPSWHCAYGAGVETDLCGGLALQETTCDGVDNDCDNAVDDAFPLKGTPCDDAGIGVCRGTGSYVCDAAGTDVTCNITSPGAMPGTEVCNGLDDDCDGTPDDGAPDAMVNVAFGGMNFWIYTYEASRPDASAGDDGSMAHRSCSRAGVIPWRTVTKVDAEAACAAAGKRLCTAAEWEAACEGSAGLTYPYGNTYDADACNGNDYDPSADPGDQDLALPTGSTYGAPACVSPVGAFDMSGNVKEWTSTAVSATAFRIRGGAYDNVSGGLTCQFNFLAGATDYAFPNLGFRCCSDTGP